MYIVYILKSDRRGTYYIGQTENLVNRLQKHNNGRVRATKSGMPWRVIHSEEYGTRQEAFQREHQIKRYKGGEAFKRLIKH